MVSCVIYGHNNILYMLIRSLIDSFVALEHDAIYKKKTSNQNTLIRVMWNVQGTAECPIICRHCPVRRRNNIQQKLNT
jgi:hypothetical protein